jgi:hypothetical protein
VVGNVGGNDGGYETNTELEYSKDGDSPEVYSPSANKKNEIVD